jgi:hypothetical protein
VARSSEGLYHISLMLDILLSAAQALHFTHTHKIFQESALLSVRVNRCHLTDILRIYLSIHLSMALQPFVGLWPLFPFLDLFTQSVGLPGRGSARREAASCKQDSTNTE